MNDRNYLFFRKQEQKYDDEDPKIFGLHISNTFSAIRCASVDLNNFLSYSKYITREDFKRVDLLRDINDCVVCDKPFNPLKYFKSWGEVPELFLSSREFPGKEDALRSFLHTMYSINQNSKVEHIKQYNKRILKRIYENLYIKDRHINDIAFTR